MKGLSIEALAAVSGEDATELLARCMGDAFGREKSVQLWEWKHRKNPAGESVGLAAFGPKGELIGLRPFMCWRLRDADGAKVSAVRAVDTAVHPDWRRSGLFSRMTVAALEQLADAGVDLVFNTPNDRSGPGYRKMGWHLLGHPRVWVRPRPFSLTQRSVDSPCNGLKPFPPEDAAALAEIGAHGPDDGLIVEKSTEYLRWRYGGHPNLAYSLVSCEAGVAVVRPDRRAGRLGVAVVDMFLRESTMGARYRLLGAVLRETSGAYVVMGPQSFRASELSAYLRGFAPIPWRNVNLAARPVGWSDEAAVFHDRGAWGLTLGDLETF